MVPRELIGPTLLLIGGNKPRRRLQSSIRTVLIGLSMAGLALPALSTTAQALPMPLATPEGLQLLSSSTARADYGSLAQDFITQASLSSCGVASSVMVLNSLKVPAPEVAGYGSYRFWTQDNLWSGTVAGTVVSAADVGRRGMTLEELSGLLKAHGLQTETIHGQDLDLEAFRRRLETSLRDPSDRLLVNYDRRSVGQIGGGHISPLAAYHRSTDQVLILDVARYRYPTVWVPVRDLWQAIRTIDPDSGRSRGLVRVTP